MKLELLPDKLLCARSNYITNQLASLPSLTISDKEIIRMRQTSESGKIVYRKVYPNSPNRQYYEELLRERTQLQEELAMIKAAWISKHKYPICKDMKVSSIYEGPLSYEKYCDLKEYSNPYPIETNYISGGRRFRSRLELHTAETLDLLGLDWKYEPEISLYMPGRFQGDMRVISLTPDFAVGLPELKRYFLIECLGRLADSAYTGDSYDKLKIYAYNGIYPSRDMVLIPGNNNYMPSEEAIISSIVSTLNFICSGAVVSMNQSGSVRSLVL